MNAIEFLKDALTTSVLTHFETFAGRLVLSKSLTMPIKHLVIPQA